MSDVTDEQVLKAKPRHFGRPGMLWVLSALLIAGLSGCGLSSAPPKTPRVRVEGPPGTRLGFTVTYFDGPGNMDANASGKVIPESGVYTENLQAGHKGVLVQLIPNSPASVTLILLDDTKEIRRATAQGEGKSANVLAGSMH
jgi:hypothetical protein